MIVRLAVLSIKAYQRAISPFLGNNCRFYPSCSQYGIECFEKYSFLSALFRICKRLLRCHPWHPGGIDLP